eukprot:CAMPEP_0202700584 /NCGR_PEP_ID=MMETSP1385-20130828/13764_1 /ASSEMBLY_ACC=CAM_ASM_000861 /TAXON_ID=933848 /ORGANISM="Elphidium margaritaceum" /LENGTH=404 /DNA_ID=CAMNT_0049357801 /DNA_START=119 /DNA_END=1333 /DNA_ORIENTATION=-
MLNSLLSDLNLDISFAPNLGLADADNVYDDYYIDASPSSMIRFPSLSSFVSNRANMRMPAPFSRAQPRGLFLMVQSAAEDRVHPKRSTYQLTQTQQVNGDTYRYSVRSRGDKRPLIHSWSTQKMYLCNNADCSAAHHDGMLPMQMMDVMDVMQGDDDDDSGAYMHLVPLSSLEPLVTDFEADEFVSYDDVGDEGSLLSQLSGLMSTAQNSFQSFLNYFMSSDGDVDYSAYDSDMDVDMDVDADMDADMDGTYTDWFDLSFGGLLNSVLYDDATADFGDDYEYEYEYGYAPEKDESSSLNTMVPNEVEDAREGEQALPNAESEEVEFAMNNDRLLVDESASDPGQNDKIRYLNHGFLLVEMTIIIVLIMVCGVCYSGYKWLLSRRERRRENDYYNINMNVALVGK